MKIDNLISAATADDGAAIDPPCRAHMEACFQTCFEGVRLHFSKASRAANLALGSLAFTVDEHICFAMPPDFLSAQAFTQLLAHELTHVAQKRKARGLGMHAYSAASEKLLEKEARAATAAVMRGFPVSELTPDSLPVPRLYGPAGHYYTAFWTSLAVGFDQVTAARIAFFTQMPDQVKELDATAAGISMTGDATLNVTPIQTVMNAVDAYQEWTVQTGLHALTGLPAETETQIRTKNFDGLTAGSLEFGLAVHAYGDSYAHRDLETGRFMYSPGLGHAVEKFNGVDPHLPDNLNHRPLLYHEYGKNLYGILAHKTPNGSRPQVPLATFESDMDDVSRVTDEPGQIANLLDKIKSILAKSGSGSDVTDFMSKMYRPETDDTHGFPLQKSDIQLPPEWNEFYQKHTSDVQQSGKDDALKWAKEWSHCAVPFQHSIEQTIEDVEQSLMTITGLNLSPSDFINQLYGGSPH